MRKIKVLVVDDSLFYRKLITEWLSGDPDIEVVGHASDAFEASKKITELTPDVMTLDLEMPVMNGIEFLRNLMPKSPLPVIVISSASERVFEALEAGALDFVAKYEASSGKKLESFINDLTAKVKIASVANLKIRKKTAAPGLRGAEPDKLIAIGASTGGTEAVLAILKELPPDLPGIVVVQHMPPVFTNMYAQRLNKILKFQVSEAKDGDEVKSGRVLIAPGDRHMKVVKSGGGYKVRCVEGEKVSGHCPSVDVLFNSAADAAGKNAVGVILTGMGSDGAKGLLTMRAKGARTIGQDKDSSVVYGMPKAAFELGAVEQQASLDKIPQLICSLVKI
ncbi:MAG: protein-glutamate methylesterase/protein-glutamine glutaminase [Oscillospiraceae bacterium]|jgi:two-component system chemotaxis response regulator CheB